ncbi:hypothetical protein QFC21_002373 [Naganishia friedmannii]|uniref:Uncharacterized protein n=1 Tax=Naganishia friedmannii TaxID=89922 RepID=A0ACC2VXS5_9TREE|nr:hypothetical protein QFC21_002373 [Naganishia friedmannii]
MRSRLTGHLSAYKARGEILDVCSPFSRIPPSFQKSNVVQLTFQGQYSTRAHPNTRSSKRSVTAISGTRSFPKARDARFTSVQNEKWLEFDLNDDFIPEQVRSSGWRIKVLDIAHVVSHVDGERLHKALREFHKARGKLDRQKKDVPQADSATRLVKTFEDVQLRAEKKFQAEAQRDVDQLTTEEANLRRDVALALDQLQNLQNVPQNTSETHEQEVPSTSEPVKVNERLEPVKVEGISQIQLDAADTAQKVQLKRFQSENTLAWIQGKRLQHAIAWAEENAQSKRKLVIVAHPVQAGKELISDGTVRKFQFYLSGESPHASVSDVESAKAEYANALERQRFLSLELDAEDGAIIIHKPARPPPVVLQPQAQLVPESAISEHMAVIADVASLPQEERPPASESKAGLPASVVLPDVQIPDPVSQTVLADKAPKHGEPRTGLFASVQRVYARVVSALTNPWKTVVQLVKRKRKIAATVVRSSVVDDDVKTPNLRDDLHTPMLSKRSTAEKVATLLKPKKESGFLRFMKSHQATVNAKAGQFVESTDWASMGFQNYGHWLATRLDKPITPRESAYIDQLLSAPRNSPFIRKRHRQAWRSYIADLGRDHARYASEVTDSRVIVHLEEILPTRTTGAEELSANSTTQQGFTLQQQQAVDLFTSLQYTEKKVLEVHTDGSFHEKQGEPSQSGGGILIKTEPNEIREVCYMGAMMHDPSEAEMGAIYRGLQILRDTLQSSGKPTDMPRYQRVLIATDSIQVLEALCGYSVWYTELRKMTRMAALCRMEAYDIVQENSDIDRIDFVWLPRLTHGNADADFLARAGRLSGFNFINDDRASTSDLRT